jgi:L-alanine-DL-glutamate epimerase-like enolase superfamily enzyme
VVINGGYVDVPKGNGLGVRLNPDWFKPERSTYRISKISS